MDNIKKQTRTRNYATVVYPESAPADWLEILKKNMIPCFVSPLHDKDVNPDGTPKKAHYHVQILFDNVKTLEQAKQIFQSFGGVGCERVNSLRGYARYLCHLDNPEKYQYQPADVMQMYGADYKSVISLPTDKYACIRDMMNYCKTEKVYAYCDLLDYAREYRDDWFNVLCDNGTYVLKEYLKSLWWKADTFGIE